jgi:hypothetical protein
MMFSYRAARATIHSPVTGFRKTVLVGFHADFCACQCLSCFALITHTTSLDSLHTPTRFSIAFQDPTVLIEVVSLHKDQRGNVSRALKGSAEIP